MNDAARAHLLVAVTRIEAALEGLDTSQDTCPHCKVRKYRSFEEYNEATQLKAIIERLRRFASPRRRTSTTPVDNIDN